MTTAPELAAAVRELAAYSDDEEKRAMLDFVRAMLDQDAGAGDVVD